MPGLKRAVISVFLLVFLFGAAEFTEAATPEECARVKQINPSVVCDASTPFSNFDNLYISKAAQDAKDYLYSIRCYESAGGTTARISANKLDPEFAICAANFLKAAKSGAVPDVCFREGYRTPAQQAKPSSGIKCKPRRSDGWPCAHPQAVAIDVNTKMGAKGYQILHEMAPKFGLVFNVSGPSGGDPFHFESIARRRELRQNALTSKAIRIADSIGVPKNACDSASYTPTPETFNPGYQPPKPANPLREYFRERQADQCKKLSQECLSSGSQECLSRYYQQCQGGAAIPSSNPGGVSGGGAQSAGSSQTQPQSVSTSATNEKNTSTNQNTSNNQPTSTVHTVTVGQGTNDTLASVFGEREIATTSEKAKEVEDIALLLEQIASEKNGEASTTTTVRSIEVPLPELVDVATVFEERGNLEIKNIDYLSDDIVSIEVQLREPDGTSGISGFFAPAGDTFAIPTEPEGRLASVCRERPWNGVSITSTIVSPIFDSVCRITGAELGEDDLHLHGE